MAGTARPQADGMITWSDTCVACGKPAEVAGLDPGAVNLWRDGMFIQDAFPQLSDDEREILISGMHGDCYDWWYPPE